MSAQNPATRGGPKREAATRRAFIVWMAAYAAVILAIAVHTLAGMPLGTTIDPDGVKTQQAKVTGEPQSSLGHDAATFKVAFGNEG